MVDIREIGKETEEISDILKIVFPSNYKSKPLLRTLLCPENPEALNNKFMYDTQSLKHDYLGALIFWQATLWPVQL